MTRRKQSWEDVPMPGMDGLKRTHDHSEAVALKPAKTEGSAWCPGCKTRPTDATAIGVIRVGDHLVYRVHTRVTFGDRRRECPTSGVRLCDSPPIWREDSRIDCCPCGN